MSLSSPAVRRRRSVPTIGITGAAMPLADSLIERLANSAPPPKLIALGTDRRQLAGATWQATDIDDLALADRLAGIDVLVHLAVDRSPTTPSAQRRAVNVHGTQRVLDAAAAARIGRVVLLTSAMVYGAHPDNPIPLVEDGPLLVDPGDGLVADWLGVERAALARTSTEPRLDITVVRPASLVGPVTDALLPGLFEAVRLLGIRDAQSHWQFCHVDDLLDALAAAALGDVSGVVTVGCEGSLSRGEVEQIAGMRSIVLPSSVAFATAERLHRIGALSMPSSDLHYLMHPWVVGSQQLRATAWTPRWTNEDALREHLRLLGDRAGRGLMVLDRKDATRAAAGAAAGAGATLAVIGSLALARARRRR